jgi:N-acetylmuramoyl-L-alanine amidase
LRVASTLIDKIVIHCSDSPHGRGDDASTVHTWHCQRGWSGLGYHHVITEEGEVQAGRPHFWTGAHVKGHNEGSLGICLIGRDEFTGSQLLALRELHHDLVSQYPNAQWFNHYELDPHKTCPNFDAVGMLFDDY